MRCSLALDAGPDEDSGNQEQQRHKEDIIESGQDVETEPALRVGDGKGGPEPRIRNPRVREDRVKRHHQHHDKGTQVVDRDIATRCPNSYARNTFGFERYCQRSWTGLGCLICHRS